MLILLEGNSRSKTLGSLDLSPEVFLLQSLFGWSSKTLLSKQHAYALQCCHSWGVSFPSVPSFEERSGVVDFFCLEVEPLLWVEPELLFCLDWKNLCQTCCLTLMSQTCVWTCFWR